MTRRLRRRISVVLATITVGLASAAFIGEAVAVTKWT
jgi:hypothetical protein